MKDQTKFAHISRPSIGTGTAVNPDITKASTLLFNKAEDLYTGKVRSYGRHGSELHDKLEAAFCALENGAGASLTPSGHSATTLGVLSQVKAGDHILLTDSAYGPTRQFCLDYLSKMGVEATLYPPTIDAGITEHIKDNTRLIIMESPGSLTFEIQDVPAIVSVAKDRNVKTLIDNTWSGGLSFKAIDHGVDLSVHAATKYIGGHSDALYGAVIARTEKDAKALVKTRKSLGFSCAPEDTYQMLRGFRSLELRFRQAEKTALTLAEYLDAHPKVQRVLHPALPSHPQHDIWVRDFNGAACLFSFILKPTPETQVNQFMNALTLFGLGFSYGGYESVAIPCDPQLVRYHAKPLEGPLIRIGAGLEHAVDLIADLDKALHEHI